MVGIYSQSGQVTYGIKYYIVDTETEKDNLSNKDKIGSKCYVIESKTWYILNGEGEYVPFVGEDSTADAILTSIKNMSAEQKDELKEELDIGGGSSTENAVLYVSQSLSDDQKAQARTNIGAISIGDVPTPTVDVMSVNGQIGDVVLDAEDVGAAPAETVQSISDSTPTITPVANTIYTCGTLTGLTITNPPAQGAYSIIFTSGTTPTTTNIPTAILGLEDFAAEANTLYEINVLDNRAVIGSWAVSAT